ncbi:MAG: OmcA/MtrC family decaheme c-type cytochrome, partial [Woeseiaceae bacterium]
MYRLTTRNWNLAALMLSSALLFACSGDTGPAGPAGGTGATGPAGPSGPSGPAGSSTVPVESAERINVSFESVVIPAGGGAPTVVVRLSNDLGFGLTGLPAANLRFTLAQLTAGQNGGSSEWQSYITTEDGGIPDAQATAETATAGTFADNGDGTYTYTFAQDLTAYPAGPTYSATKTHRLGAEIRTNSGGFLPENIPANNAPYDFVPAGGAPIETRLIVNNDTCNACHDNLEFHGEARFDIEYCVTCHNPYSIDGDTVDEPWGGTVDMKQMIHKIHGNDNYGHQLANGYFIVGFGGRKIDYTDVKWTQDVRNCATCHQETNAAVPQASNWRTVQNRAACGSCHDDIDWAAGDHPGGLVFIDDSLCAGCHNETSGFTDVHVPVVHQIPEAIAAEAFAYEVVSVTNTAPGQLPTATIRVSNPLDGTTYDINDPTGPFQIGSSRLNLDISWTSVALGNIDPNDDLARAADSGAPFAPIQINFQSGAVDDGSGNFTKAASAAIPTGISGSGLAVLEGRAAVDIDGSLDNLPVSSDTLAFAITDATAQDRRKIVDIS